MLKKIIILLWTVGLGLLALTSLLVLAHYQGFANKVAIGGFIALILATLGETIVPNEKN